jgi:hypothetical protein
MSDHNAHWLARRDAAGSATNTNKTPQAPPG